MDRLSVEIDLKWRSTVISRSYYDSSGDSIRPGDIVIINRLPQWLFQSDRWPREEIENHLSCIGGYAKIRPFDEGDQEDGDISLDVPVLRKDKFLCFGVYIPADFVTKIAPNKDILMLFSKSGRERPMDKDTLKYLKKIFGGIYLK
jgi:hypothetical protein